MAEFNFIPPPKKLADTEKAAQQSVFVKVLVMSFVFVLIPTAIIVTISLLKANQLNSLESQQMALQADLDSNKDKIRKVSLVKNKLTGIKYIFDSEFDYASALKDLFGLLPPGVDLKTVTVDKTGSLQAQVFASDVTVLQSLIANLTAPDLRYKKITVGEVSAALKGGYTLPIAYLVPFKGKSL